ncbi:MAG: amidohydrolase family protein [Cyclobacteriaceae bacterium]
MVRLTAFLFLAILAATGCDRGGDDKRIIVEVNDKEILKGNKVLALVGATLIDGRGGAPIQNACVIVRNDRIEAAGKKEDVTIPDEAEIIELSGLTMLPGLIDAHYHNEDSDTLAGLFLRKGVTSVRDPGEWIESYDALRESAKPIPRLFLAGPHIDTYPPAYPADSYIVKDPDEASLAVDQFVKQGATVIKVYYGLSLEMIHQICVTAHASGLPVTAHLEVTNARDAINAGLDGIEHITSFGTCLLPMREGEQYKQKVMADNNARRRGRYEVWASIDFENNPAVDSLIGFLVEKKTFVSPTLAVFERRHDRGDSIETEGFANMLKFVAAANEGGVRFVVGSHSFVPYAELGFAYNREMELLNEAGLSNMRVIEAATLENARFFRIEERLGSIEEGKLADLFLVEGDPLKDITVMRQVRRVMLNGVWVSHSD